MGMFGVYHQISRSWIEVTTGSDCYFVIERMETHAIIFNYRLIASGTIAAHLSFIGGMHRHGARCSHLIALIIWKDCRDKRTGYEG